MDTEEAEEITTEFFKKRFPDKDLEFEKRCGYFGEWVERFKSGHPEQHMDSQSLKVWEKIKKEIKKETDQFFEEEAEKLEKLKKEAKNGKRNER